jgi:hypothetical protein
MSGTSKGAAAVSVASVNDAVLSAPAQQVDDEEEEEDGWATECDQCNVVLDKTTGEEWIAQLGSLCSRCYELRKDDFPAEE